MLGHAGPDCNRYLLPYAGALSGGLFETKSPVTRHNERGKRYIDIQVRLVLTLETCSSNMCDHFEVGTVCQMQMIVALLIFTFVTLSRDTATTGSHFSSPVIIILFVIYKNISLASLASHKRSKIELTRIRNLTLPSRQRTRQRSSKSTLRISTATSSTRRRRGSSRFGARNSCSATISLLRS